jgi:hypothetical protein
MFNLSPSYKTWTFHSLLFTAGTSTATKAKNISEKKETFFYSTASSPSSGPAKLLTNCTGELPRE